MFLIKCDSTRCVECHTCEAACKATHQVKPGIKWRWVESIWRGEYPNISNFSISHGCLHCTDAPCVDACPSGAITQNKDGIVLIEKDTCQGNQECLAACPYDVPQFGEDGKMQKCDLCFSKTSKGELPVCVQSCPSGALQLMDT